jgi:RimJ/RimL family protein N-acetyltransferase
MLTSITNQTRIPLVETLNDWTGRPAPEKAPLLGRYVRLEPLDRESHGRQLYVASNVANAQDKFRWLWEQPPTGENEFLEWVERVAAGTDPMFFAIIDLASGKVAGRQALMRIDRANGVIEIGSIYWGERIARQRGATEAFFLFMKYIFNDLGYRRFEWKCNNDNAPSKRAALRFGFTYEGLFRQHMVIKGLNRDTAWYAITDKDWSTLKLRYEAWLAPDNFDSEGMQLRKLETI